MSELVEPRQCAKCGSWEPGQSLDPEGLCVICRALQNLRQTMVNRGLMRPEAYKYQSHPALPPEDRE